MQITVHRFLGTRVLIGPSGTSVFDCVSIISFHSKLKLYYTFPRGDFHIYSPSINKISKYIKIKDNYGVQSFQIFKKPNIYFIMKPGPSRKIQYNGFCIITLYFQYTFPRFNFNIFSSLVNYLFNYIKIIHFDPV